MEYLDKYKAVFSDFMAENRFTKPPKGLYEPLDYILSIGGKRIRPLLLLMAADQNGSDFRKALPAALAVEVFHNFTLLHDDIMDKAPLRRGKPTVHEKYDTNTAILSGDVMMILAYKFLEPYQGQLYAKLMKVFNKMAVEVCEGQQMDMDFENRSDVAIPEYFQMIKHKTSVLIGAALQMGGLIAGLDEQSCNHLYHYGVNIGIAFQMQDDMLDTFGEPKIGKLPGGDIIQNKKTYLYLKTLELTDDKSKNDLISMYGDVNIDNDKKVSEVRRIMKNVHVMIHSEEVKNEYKQLAFSHLDATQMDLETKQHFHHFGDYLLNRTI